jgi:ribosomal protein L37AE/L43A
VPARKPRAGMKESVKDPETGKTKDKPKGLGHWRCTACGKVAKVTPQKPASKEVAPVTEAPDVTA